MKLATNIFNRLARREPSEAQCGIEQEVEWYDSVYSKLDTSYHQHYTDSIDYFLWTVVVDRIPRTASVLEIGCGPGQLAAYLQERGVAKYVGFDFSPQAIKMAQERYPSLEFHVGNAFATDLLDSVDYDLVICTEVLEHIEEDLRVVRRVRPGVRCLLTVPSFPYFSHVRHFADKAAVGDRYGAMFAEFRVDEIPKNPAGDRFFLLDGVRHERSGDLETSNRPSAMAI